MTVAADLRNDPPRSLLFVPADRALELLPKAFASGADAVIIDLEDALLAEQRAPARRALTAAAALPRAIPLFVRVSAAASPAFAADLAAAASIVDAGVILPKCAGPDDVRATVAAWASLTSAPLTLLPIVETARGLLAAPDSARADPSIVGIALGAEDLAAEIGATRTAAGDEIVLARSMLVLAATAAGRWAIDTPCLDVRRPAVVRADARRAAGFGFAGKLLIHPAQVGPVHAALEPTAAEIDRARRTIEAAGRLAAAGRGVGTLDGRMIDAPVVAAARRLLARAARFGAGGDAA